MTTNWYGLWKIAERWVRGYRVQQQQIQEAYDTTAPTYAIWQQRMHPHTERVLIPLPERPSDSKPLRILDLACGSGHITRRLLELLPGQPLDITGVDLSLGMIEICRQTFSDSRVGFVTADALRYLSGTPDQCFDAVYCGWGLVYLPAAQTVSEIHRVLRPGGITGIIMNRKGTLRGVEAAFIDVMTAKPSQISRVMDVRYGMPAGLTQFTRWFTQRGFAVCHSGDGEEIVRAETVRALWTWLVQSGALAGTQYVFHDINTVEHALMEALEPRLRCESGYAVNHSYVYGVFQRKR